MCLCCLALRHSPSKRKSIVADRQKSLVDGNSTFVSRDLTIASEVDAEQGQWTHVVCWLLFIIVHHVSCGVVQLTCVT